MIAVTLQMILPWTTCALYVAIAGLLIWKLVRTHERAFVWLGVAVVAWPLFSFLMELASQAALRDSVQHRPTHIFPYSLAALSSVSWGVTYEIVSGTERVIGGSLLLIATLYLCRMNVQPRVRQEA